MRDKTDLFTLPVWIELEKADRILLAGAGGGFDIFTGLPLYFHLRGLGKEVFLANLSFSQIYASTGHRIPPAIVKVAARTEGSLRYFPELYLARWFQEQGEECAIYCFDQTGVVPLLQSYTWLVENLEIDTIVLVDGGTDSLMRGDEFALGTPEEDIASIAAVNQLDIPRKLLVCLGFGIDTFHGICHAQFLEAVAEVTRAGGFMGVWSLLAEMPEVQRYRDASEYVFDRMSYHPSIVNGSILAAVAGEFGDHHATYRTEGSKLFINSLMGLYWAFRLDVVAN
jgi:hypothetical protein